MVFAFPECDCLQDSVHNSLLKFNGHGNGCECEGNILTNRIDWSIHAANSFWYTSDSVPANRRPAQSLPNLQSNSVKCLSHGEFFFVRCLCVAFVEMHKPQH